MPVLSSLAQRQRIPELMDDPALDDAEHRRALVGLARINRFTRSADALWRPIRELARAAPGKTLRILDVGTGSGDLPLELAQKARAEGIDLLIRGCDVSPTAIRTARENRDARRAASAVEFFAHDAIREPLPVGYDVVVCSLFLHHLSDDDAVLVLRRMKESATASVLVNDLERSRFSHVAVWMACRILSRSTVVHFDGPASVRSAFTCGEALALADRAGLVGAKIARRYLCRYLLQWRSTAAVWKPQPA